MEGILPLRRDIGTDDYRVRVRPGKGSRPRTKIRPDYSRAPRARVYRVDRGRYHMRLLTDGTPLIGVKARELPPGSVVVGDICAVVGDLSGKKNTLARIVKVDDRQSVLRRSSAEGEKTGEERVIAANVDQLLIISALADPPPRIGMIDRCLVAAYDGNIHPILVLTKADLASPAALLATYQDLALPTVITSAQVNTQQKAEISAESLRELRSYLEGKVSVLIGHSGVGKSTLINALVPSANRDTGAVNEVTGRGRHTSTSAMAFALPESGVVIDTPGIRTFGISHIDTEKLLPSFPDLAEIAAACPRGCRHREGELECCLEEVSEAHLRRRVASFHRLLAAIDVPEWDKN